MEACGTVVDFADSNVEYGTVKTPVIKFSPTQGDHVTFRAHFGAQHLDNLGATVRVRYDPQSPSNARVDTFFGAWGEIAVSMFFIVFGFVGVFVLIKS